MIRPNFKNPETGKEFTISNYISLIRGGKLCYCNKKTLRELCDQDGVLLIPIDDSVKMGTPSIKTPTKNRF